MVDNLAKTQRRGKYMSTRGAFGFRYLNTDKICINSTDSHLWGLGTNAVDAIVTNSDQTLLDHFQAISFEKSSVEFEGENVFFRPHYKDASSFVSEGLFCEWAYIINLDNRSLEIYSGFHAPQGQGRYNQTPQECSKRYGGVALVCDISFDILRALFSKPKYAVLAAKFYAMVTAKAELTKQDFHYEEDLRYTPDQIEEYFKTLTVLDTSKVTVDTLEAGTAFTCDAREYLKVSNEKYVAVDLEFFFLFESNYFEGKAIVLSK